MNPNYLRIERNLGGTMMAWSQVTFMIHLKRITGNTTLKQLISLSIVFKINSISLDTEYTNHWKFLLIKGCKREELDVSLEAVCTCYKNDFDQELPYAQLQTFGVHFQLLNPSLTKVSNTHLTIFNVKNYVLSLSHGQMSFFPKSHGFCSLFWSCQLQILCQKGLLVHWGMPKAPFGQ